MDAKEQHMVLLSILPVLRARLQAEQGIRGIYALECTMGVGGFTALLSVHVIGYSSNQPFEAHAEQLVKLLHSPSQQELGAGLYKLQEGVSLYQWARQLHVGLDVVLQYDLGCKPPAQCVCLRVTCEYEVMTVSVCISISEPWPG